MVELKNISEKLESIQEEYMKNKRVMLSDVWTDESASLLHEAIENKTNFLNAFAIDGKYIQSSDRELGSMTTEEKRELQRTIYKDASNGIGFFYGRHNINKNTEFSLYKALFNYLNSDVCLNFIRQITGNENVISASVQVTRYISGNFLTRHNDVLPSEGRAIAYVFGFTPNWHPDWGGLLHFFNAEGGMVDTFFPKNNTLSLFDVNLPHSVSYVTPFAKYPRYSITGWFNVI
ncbi:2OG-Fe(II) oxygenase family protein [Pseudoalteromonas sp. SG44-8]|uniref:2OG-Fe(II) oxygenase family protein n=2 Tax=unclassified Pseudoalteromonas TaxID=194690 RepID=UPI00160226FF|nr:2OG-Fe(II) oxygenase family protein [Pseudoalteromonas sp. SG44-8]MBB1400074.1 2OG-Fe(II) oxygenase [Pseudoalteromonas sp. SG44-8]